MNKKITSSLLVALMIAGSTSFSTFAAMPTGTVVIGTKAFDLTYANNSANAFDITAAVAGGGAVYVKNFEGNWIDNTTGNTVQSSLIPAVVYKDVAGVVTNFDIADTDVVNANTDITSKFTDETFKNKVYSLIRKASPSPILYSDVKNITTLDLSNSSDGNIGNSAISNLSGIEYFTALTDLNCFLNNLTTLDVSKNTALTNLNCENNNLTTLDVSKNTALTTLQCGTNNLATLDTSKNTALIHLYCTGNNLTALDVSKNTALINLSCVANKIATLDVSKNTALANLNCENNNLTILDVSKNIDLNSLYCSSNKLATLDVVKNTALIELFCGYNNLTTLDVSKNIGLDYFQCDDNELTTLYSIKDTWGISSFRPQYSDSTHTTLTADAEGLIITIKN